MDCENGAAGEDRSKVGEFKEEILQLAALASQGEVYSVVVVIWKQFGGKFTGRATGEVQQM
jgi:hypothetical protein